MNCTACNKPSNNSRCPLCNEPVQMPLITKGEVKPGKTYFEKYADFLPFKDNNISMQEGATPLIKSNILQNLYLKNETQNPTWSFKDRGTITAILHAIKQGYTKIGTVSTGNMAVSVAAYGAKANLKTYILVGKTIPAEKIGPIAAYGVNVIKVDGDYGKLYFKSLEFKDIAFLNSDVPARIEGYKTIAFEISEQLNYADYVIVPTSAGGNIRGILKGFIEFFKAGIIPKIPTIVCAQAKGCAAIVDAYEKGLDKVQRISAPDTIAHAIRNPYPPSGNEVLRKLKQHNGLFVSVTDEEILLAQKQLASEGLFVQPASAVSVAAARKLRKNNTITPEESIVCILTGSGLKYTKILEKFNYTTNEIAINDLKEHLE